ncbi:MAG: hypothetical protein AB1Z98_03290 [Nannocystaceae bacterium]
MTDGSPLTSPGTPVYEVSVTTSGLDLEVRVNDVPVMRVSGGHVETTFDVNPHVVTGSNHLGAIVRPPAKTGQYVPQAGATIVLRVRAAPGSSAVEERGRLVFEVPQIEADRAFSGSRTPEGAEPVVAIGTGDIVQARIPVNLLTPFPPWSWISADQLTDTPEIFDEVLAQTKTLWGLIQAKDVAALEAAAAEQTKDWRIAYYLSDDEQARTMLGIASTLGDPDVQPAPFPDPAGLRLQVLGFGKLARLVDEEGKDPIVLGVKGVPNMSGRFTALLCRRDGTWSMIR